MAETPPLRRFSSRTHRLGRDFLADRLAGATAYRRIAGYFRSSIFELVGEEIAAIPDVRIVCNSDLDPADLEVSKAAREVALKAKFCVASPGEEPALEALLRRDRYARLYSLLTAGNVKVRVVPRDKLFLHGKAGVIDGPGGSTSFLGSINETRNAFSANHEILWEDPSPEGVAWVNEEFEALWESGHDLPDAVIEEVGRVAERVERRLADTSPEKLNDLPGAVMAESPIYRGGEQLQPWQRAFVTTFLEHRETYGSARLLLADEVGLGKTLSLATAAMMASLLGDGPALILCPSTLVWQWQVELKDRLGVPSAVWHSGGKEWHDPDGHRIRTRGAKDVVHCPFQVGIVSTGLVMKSESVERRLLMGQRFGTLVLDEAHKARTRGGLGGGAGEPNFLMDFMLAAAPNAKHLLLGTATPIQTSVGDLWDLLKILSVGNQHVVGHPVGSCWPDRERVQGFLTGAEQPDDESAAWELCRNPLPPRGEDPVFRAIRDDTDLDDREFTAATSWSALGPAARAKLRETMDGHFFRQHNPIVRHTVLRRRSTLEEANMLKRIAVDVHPDPLGVTRYPGVGLSGQGLRTNAPFDLAYQAAERYTTALGKRKKSAGFMRSLLLQRICSSFAAGKATAERLLAKGETDASEEAEWLVPDVAEEMSPEEADALREIINELARDEARDPKLAAVEHFLLQQRAEAAGGQGLKTWLELGCIVFSQYYDTAAWLAERLADILPEEPIAVYAGVGRSRLFRDGRSSEVDREAIKAAVRDRAIRLVIATDAACEGLNLQTLGTLINVDLPWNPSRLEQRLGRIKRYGQARESVDMLNLVYHDTRDEKVYETLSTRLKDRFDLFGGLPDTIKDDWIVDEETLRLKMDEYTHLRQQAVNAFDVRYQDSIDPKANRWERCSEVLARRDIEERLSQPW